MRRLWFGSAVGVMSLALVVPGASGRPQGWSSGRYQLPLQQIVATGTSVLFTASQTQVTLFAANVKMDCTGTCPEPAIRAVLHISGAIPISSSGRFRATVQTRTDHGSAITVSVNAQLSGKTATGSLQYSSITDPNGGQYSGGDLTFTAVQQGATTAASLFRAYGDVVFNAQPPYGYPGTPITLLSASEVDQDIAAVGATTLRTWSARGTNCKTMQNLATTAVSPDGHFINARTYRFSTPGIYTICADLLDSSGQPVTPLTSSQPPPWPINPILVCPKGTTIYYATVGLGCKPSPCRRLALDAQSGETDNNCACPAGSRAAHTSPLDRDGDRDVNRKGVFVGPPDGDCDDGA
jgi:hypothetical protein